MADSRGETGFQIDLRNNPKAVLTRNTMAIAHRIIIRWSRECFELNVTSCFNSMKSISLLRAVRWTALPLFLTSALSLSAAGDWRYDVLAESKIIKADSITSRAGDSLLDFSSIDVGGFRTGRLFVQVLQSDFMKNQGRFTREAKLRVSCFHNTKSGANEYFEKQIPMIFSTYISGWVEIPIVGPDLRIVIWGDTIPREEMNATCTLYLLK